MKFWDSSAIAPLLVKEADSGLREDQLRHDPVMLVWFGTPAELESAICRRVREKKMDETNAQRARDRLGVLAASWIEVQATPVVRARALRLLRVHALRAADAFQLAAALVACRDQPAGHSFLSGDARLLHAARLEGFEVG